MSNHEVDEMIVRKMKDMVPEYISNNSEYEKLDQLILNKNISDTEKTLKLQPHE